MSFEATALLSHSREIGLQSREPGRAVLPLVDLCWPSPTWSPGRTKVVIIIVTTKVTLVLTPSDFLQVLTVPECWCFFSKQWSRVNTGEAGEHCSAEGRGRTQRRLGKKEAVDASTWGGKEVSLGVFPRTGDRSPHGQAPPGRVDTVLSSELTVAPGES